MFWIGFGIVLAVVLGFAYAHDRKRRGQVRSRGPKDLPTQGEDFAARWYRQDDVGGN